MAQRSDTRTSGAGASGTVQRGPRNILVVTYWSYADALVQTYTLPYVRMILRALPPGSRIHLVTLEKAGPRSWVPAEEPGIMHHGFAYSAFGMGGFAMVLKLAWRLSRLVRAQKVDKVHAWCTPAGMIGYLVSVVCRIPLVIDSYEPHAEAMVENGTWRRGGIAHRVLFLFEGLQSRRASVLIAATSGMRDYAAARYGRISARWFVKPACVDAARFSERSIKRPELVASMGFEGRLVMLYAGKFGGIYLDQGVFDLFRAARDRWGDRLRVLLLTPHTLEELAPFIERAGLDRSLFTVRWVPHGEVPDLMGLADVAVTPVKPVPTKRYCTPVKDGEYWALGIPVIITEGISDDTEIIRRHRIGSVITSLDRAGYRRAVDEMAALLEGTSRQELYERVRSVALRYRDLGEAERIYRRIYGE